MSEVIVDTLKHSGNSGTANITLASGGGVTVPDTLTVPTKKLVCPGTIIQVQTGQDTAASTISLGGAFNWTNLSTFSVQITPTAASSKILISGYFGGEADWEDHGIYYKLVRDVASVGASDIAIGDAAGNRLRVTGVVQPGYHGNDQDSTTAHTTIPNYLDSPNTTNQITYSIYICADSASKTWYLNRTLGSTDAAAYERLSSWMTVQEVAA